ncbi:MAG: hypothetical protein H7199_02080, partial [Burkholderiales bacterium]|nr:hypothetical protein [Flavobacterium sp.]
MRNKYVLILFSLSVYFNFFSLTPVLQAQCVPASLIKVTVPVPLPACNPGDCTDLLAVYNIPKQTNDYAVSTIGYCPSFPFTGGTVINATGDDVWSSTVNLPFSVCFYGVNYNRVLVGTNGVVTFDLAGQTPGGYCNWPFTATIPNPGFAIRNAIYGVYQDTDIRIPPVTNYAIQNVNYYVLDTGVNAAPNRVFVANFNELPQYSCGTAVGFQTSQIVIHETTNIIDIVVSKRTSCTGWNSGSGLIGVQNQAGTLARVPPGRNTGTWSATNEAWRFTPIGPNTTVSLAWLENGTPIGTTNPINVCPSATGPNLYTAVVTYTRCDGSTVSVQDDIIVDIAPPLPLNNPHDIIICTPNPPPYTVDINENADILLGVPNPADYLIKYYEDQNDAINDTPTNINLISDAPLATFLVPVVPKTIYVRLEDFVTTGCFNVRSFIIDATASPSGTFLYPATPYCNSITTPQPITPTALTSGGTYSSMPAGLILNASTGAVTPSGSTVGTYLVTYNIVASANCPAYSTTANVEIKICTCTVVASSAAETLCVNTALNPITYTVAGGAVSASVTAGTLPPGISGSFSGGVYTLSGIPTSSGVYNFTVSVDSSTDVCTAATTITVNPNVTITLSSAATTANQTVCINAAITSITYSITNGGTGANIVGLPTGVSGSYLGGVFTITGIPTQSGTFNYLITTSGGCSTASLGGTITVNPNATIVLTSAPATANQTLCINTAIANIIYTIGSGGTGAAVIGLPTGISGSYSGGLFTMTGIPTQSGTFNYAVTTSGGCSTASLGGTITVNPNVTIALSSAPSTTSQTLCINTAIAPITYAITNAGILGGTVSGLPTGVSGSYSGGVFTISGSPTQSGTFNYLI